jgi:hypothetical protein
MEAGVRRGGEIITLNRRQARWSLHLSEFNLKLEHLPGSKMFLSDALSQCPNHCIGAENNNDDVIVLPDNLFLNLLDLELQQQISTAMTKDVNADILSAIDSLLNAGPTNI